ncbi:MAG: CTP synthase [Candidatus Helarchaeota archaeon]
MTKFIFVTGGVMSAIGKGVTTASLGKLFQFRNYDVSAIKIDPYLNVDPGTLNPIEHGEVFITEEVWDFVPSMGPNRKDDIDDLNTAYGKKQVYRICEIDQDFGTYERFLDKNLHPSSNITSGQVYLSVILQERYGEYLGRTVQIIPHVTDEIKRRIRQIAEKDNSDVVITEIGGTVGDIEAMPYLEAVRQFRLEEPKENTALVHVTLIPYSEAVGELKTKPTQHSVKTLLSLGLQPDIIIGRAKIELTEQVRQKISLYCNVPVQGVISNPELSIIYELPLIFEKFNLGTYLIHDLLQMVPPKPDISKWEELIEKYKNPKHSLKIAMPGKYTLITDSYVSINEALKHAAAHLDSKIKIEWIDAEPFEKDRSKVSVLSGYDGILMTPGFGERGVEGMILAARHAIQAKIPFLGICYGAQILFCAFCREFLGLDKAASTEFVPETCDPVVDLLPEQKKIKDKGGTMRLGGQEIYFKEGSILHDVYEVPKAVERFRHRYHIITRYAEEAQQKGLVISSYDKTGTIINSIEYVKDGNWMIGVQFHPEYKSRPARPSPVYLAFVKKCLEKKIQSS